MFQTQMEGPHSCLLTSTHLMVGSTRYINRLQWCVSEGLENPPPIWLRLKDLQVIQKEIWSQLAAAYAPGTPETPHEFQVGDLVYI